METQNVFGRWQAPRRIVRLFAGLMEAVLRDNDWKGGWGKEQPANDLRFFHNKLSEEVDELLVLLRRSDFDDPVDPTEIAREAADVANIAMMIADNWGRKVIEMKEITTDALVEVDGKLKHIQAPVVDLGPLSSKPESADYSSGCGPAACQADV